MIATPTKLDNLVMACKACEIREIIIEGTISERLVRRFDGTRVAFNLAKMPFDIDVSINVSGVSLHFVKPESD